jgi:hypothetical protein
MFDTAVSPVSATLGRCIYQGVNFAKYETRVAKFRVQKLVTIQQYCDSYEITKFREISFTQ